MVFASEDEHTGRQGLRKAQKKLLTPEEAAEYLGTTPKTLASWRCTGKVKVPYVKLGDKVLYRIESLERFLDEHTVNGESNRHESARQKKTGVKAKVKKKKAA